MARVLLFLLIVGAVVYVVDISNSEDDERLGMPPFLWIVLVILVPVLGTIVWLAVSRTQRARRGTRPGTSTSYRTLSHPTQPQQPLAPDDDPEFLWLLEQARIKRQREEQAQASGEQPPATGGDSRGEDDGHRAGDQDGQPRA
jgi:hypothetical protein